MHVNIVKASILNTLMDYNAMNILIQSKAAVCNAFMQDYGSLHTGPLTPAGIGMLQSTVYVKP